MLRELRLWARQPVLVRSITPFSLRDPHTGTLVYTEGTAKIPAAAITVEDAEAIHRLTSRGNQVRVRLKMAAHFEPDADSNNVIGEIPGSEKPEEVVVLGGHIDSWECWPRCAGRWLRNYGFARSGRADSTAWTEAAPHHSPDFLVNEENGGAGGKAYRAMVGPAIAKHVAAIEMDGGAEKPIGFGAGLARQTLAGGASAVAPGALSEKAFERLKAIGNLLTSIGANQITRSGGGSDIEPLMESGVPGLGELSSGAHYFDWHHTEADTFDKINPQDFRESVASMAVMAFVLADMPDRLSDLQ